MSKPILVVDNSATVRRQLRTFLEAEGFAVEEAGDGVEGLEVASGREFSLMLVDISMPRMNGIELIRELRKSDDHSSTPIFVLTTETAGDAMRAARAAGATAWLVKPFNPDRLLKGIRRVL